MRYRLCDLIGTLGLVNPFPNDPVESLKAKAEEKLRDDPLIFVDDWLNTCHSPAVIEIQNITYDVFGKPLTINLNDNPTLEQRLKSFFSRHADELHVSDEMKAWAGTEVEVPNEDVEEEAVEEEVTEREVELDERISLPSIPSTIVPIKDVERSSYDFTSDYPISYDELSKLCLMQAKKSYVSSQIRAQEIEKAQEVQRQELTKSIRRYLELREIKLEYGESGLDKLTLDELTVLQKRCEDKYDALKTKEMVKTLLSSFQTAYEAFCPNGIPVGRTRHWRISPDVTQELAKQLFDPWTVPGHAFRRILDKHHVHLPDEATVLLEVFRIIKDGSTLVKDEPEEDEEEEYEEEEELNEEDEVEEES